MVIQENTTLTSVDLIRLGIVLCCWYYVTLSRYLDRSWALPNNPHCPENCREGELLDMVS